jgi:hypothetical protein
MMQWRASPAASRSLWSECIHCCTQPLHSAVPDAQHLLQVFILTCTARMQAAAERITAQRPAHICSGAGLYTSAALQHGAAGDVELPL